MERNGISRERSGFPERESIARNQTVAVDGASDAELLTGIAARDETAIDRVVQLHGPAVYGTALRLLKDESLADEVAQDTFVALWMQPERVQSDKGSLRSFLRGIARYKAIDLIRRDEARRCREQAISGRVSLDDFAHGVIERLDHERLVDRVLGELTELQREAVLVTYYGQVGSREAAEALGVPVATFKTRLRDGLQSLRRVLDTA